MKAAIKLDRFIKDSSGEKVPMKTTSMNLKERHLIFIQRKHLNLSALVREFIDQLMAEDEKKTP